MSAFEIALDPSLIVFAILAGSSVISALLIVMHKSLIYSAFFLAVLGISNAAIFALLGFAFIALFQVVVYIGAAVTFILFSVSMFEKIPTVEQRIRIVTIVIVLSAFAMLAAIFGTYFTGTLQTSYVSYRDLAALLVDKYWFALLIAALTLITTLIEAITLARNDR